MGRLSGFLGRFRSNPGLSLTGREVALSGTVDSDDLKTTIDTEAGAALPEGYTYRSGITVEAPAAEVIEAETAIRSALIEPIQFSTGTASFVGESAALLDNVAATLNEYESLNVRVEGHTDNTGSAEANQSLSQQRAEAVVQYLVDQGVSAERLSAVGYGQARPQASNDTEEGRAQNRRVAFTVVS
ncbi:MAG: OmpA family protein [Bacteroidota bacterium]